MKTQPTAEAPAGVARRSFLALRSTVPLTVAAATPALTASGASRMSIDNLYAERTALAAAIAPTANIKSWAIIFRNGRNRRSAGGYPFRSSWASPESQDAIFRFKFGGYVKQYGNPQDAASAWLTGKPLS